MSMRVAVGQSPVATNEYLSFAAQLGVAGVQFNTPQLPGDARWEYGDLKDLVERVARWGLVIEAIENVPNSFYQDVMLGGPLQEEQIENLCYTIRNMGRAGIPILGLNFEPQSVWRTDLGPGGRGGAIVSRYNHAIAADRTRADEVWVARRDQRVADAKDGWTLGSHLEWDVDLSVDDDSMWENFFSMVGAIAPVAEESSVRIAFHPDDPPVPELHGIAHILRSVDALERAVTTVPSPAIGLDLCLGTVSEMGGRAAVLDAVQRLVPAGKVFYIHLRDVQGTVPDFTECFLGEGNYSPVEVLSTLHQLGFEGFILDDHTPCVVNDEGYGYRGRAHAIGYLQGILECITSPTAPLWE